MAVFATSVTKEILWRGNQSPVSNVYHHKTSPGQTFDDNAVIDEIVRLEKLIYGTSVKFIGARTWGPTEQGVSASKMREVRQLTGTGANSSNNVLYPELSIMCYWPLGRYGVRNHPQYLRKWHHTANSQGLPSDGTRSTAAVPQVVTDYMAGITSLDPAGLMGAIAFCTEDGEHEAPIGGGRLYPFLEHRQIGR